VSDNQENQRRPQDAGHRRWVDADAAMRAWSEHALHPLVVTGPDLAVLYVSDAVVALTGFSREELIGSRYPYPWWAEEDAEQREKTFIAAWRTGDPKAEIQIQRKDGGRRWIRTAASPVPGEKGEYFFLTSWTDITEIVSAREREAHLNRVLHAIRDVGRLITLESNANRLLLEACRLMTSTNGYHNAWIGLFDDDGAVRNVAHAGFDKRIAPLLEQFGSTRQPSCVQRARETGQVLSITNPPRQCHDCPLAPGSAERGSLVRRLEHEGRIFGLLCVSAPPRFVEDPEEIELLGEIAADLSFALHAIEARRGQARAQAELDRQHDMYQLTLEHLTDALFLTDDAGDFTFVCPNVFNILGFSSEEIAARGNVAEVLKGFPHAPPAIHARGEIANTELEIATKDGRTRTLLVNAKSVAIHGATILYACRDITERKAADQKIRAINERLEGILSSISDGFYALDNNLVFTFFNDSARQILGVPDVPLVGRPASEVFPEATGTILETNLVEVLRTRRPAAFEVFFDTPPYVNWYEVRCYPYENGVAVYFQVTTERKRAEAAAELSKQRLKAMLQLAEMHDTDESEIAHFVMEQAIALTGSTYGFVALAIGDSEDAFRPLAWSTTVMKECVTQEAAALFNPSEGGVWAEALRQRKTLIINDYNEPHPAKIGLPEGHVAVTNLLNLPVFEGDRIVAMVGVANAATGYSQTDEHQVKLLADGMWRQISRHRQQDELRSLEAQLRQSQKMEAVGRLAGGVAHDFNNLLTGIQGYTEIMADSIAMGDPMLRDLEQVSRAAEQAAKLTQQLLAFSRRQVIAPQVVNLNELIFNSQGMIERMIGEDIDLQFWSGADLWWVKVDPHQLDQILINLATNARDAMPSGGKMIVETANVTVATQKTPLDADLVPGDYVRLTVSDNGEGMDESTCARAFEPFFTTKEMGRGTGLGLATIYGIVKQNHGFISVESQPGQGAAFTVLLPRCLDAALESSARRAPSKAAGGSETILLVEDEELVRNLFVRILRGHGYDVHDAAGGGEALLFCDRHQGKIDLLVTDVIMPTINGRELYDRLHKLRPETKVLFISGYSEEIIGRHGVLEDEVSFLQKPFSVEVLARRVRKILDF
jgi:PAS domain S-box-containing protein